MDYETLDRVMTEAEDIGVNFFVISVGEPTVRMDDLISLANKHNESMFHVFSNGTPNYKGKSSTVRRTG